jgi:hypothetical protein
MKQRLIILDTGPLVASINHKDIAYEWVTHQLKNIQSATRTKFQNTRLCYTGLFKLKLKRLRVSLCLMIDNLGEI